MYVCNYGKKGEKGKKELTLFLGLGTSNRKAAMKYSSPDIHSIDKCNNVRKLCREGMEQVL